MSSRNVSGDDDDTVTYSTVVEQFQSHFMKKRNVIFERARFNQKKQQEDETFENFITSLYKLAEHCQYDALKEQMILDRIVVGLKDASLSEKLQLDSGLTLEKAILKARQSKMVNKQQQELRSQFQEVTEEFESLKVRQKPPHAQSSLHGQQRRVTETTQTLSGRCGHTHPHPRTECQARDAECFKCEKWSLWICLQE